MTKAKSTKRALLLSGLALLLCVSMLVGSTFAWFTDTVKSGSNVIKSGNLDIVVEYTLDGDTWEDLDGADDLFQKGLWEPGHTEVVALRVRNNGSLALKYKANMNIVSETKGQTEGGDEIVLSEVLTVNTLKLTEAEAATAIEKAFESEDGVTYPSAVSFNAGNILSDVVSLAAAGQDNDVHYYVIRVDMDEAVGNEANHDGSKVPSITFGINVYATQDTVESDSFGDDYDENAEFPWDGVSTKKPAQDEYGYYLISSPAELAWLAEGTSARMTDAKLTADIDMLGATISPIEMYNYHTFDGNGKTISNVVVEGSGLFGDLSASATIQNLTVDKVTVNPVSGDCAGILNGKYSGKYTNVTVKNSTVNAPNQEYVGGLAGKYYKNLTDCTVENCTVIGAEKVGGLVGFFTLADVGYSIKLSNCSVNNVTVTATNSAKPYAGLIFGRGLATSNYKFTFENCSVAMKDGQKLIGQDYYNNIDVSAITVTTID